MRRSFRTTLVTGATTVGLLAWSVVAVALVPPGGWDAFVTAETGASMGSYVASGGPGGTTEVVYDNDGGAGPAAATIVVGRVADATGIVTVAWQWVGHHGHTDVTAELTPTIDGVSGTTVALAATDCCASPSGGFSLDGVETFDVAAGETFGFVIDAAGNEGRIDGVLRLSDGSIDDGLLIDVEADVASLDSGGTALVTVYDGRDELVGDQIDTTTVTLYPSPGLWIDSDSVEFGDGSFYGDAITNDDGTVDMSSEGVQTLPGDVIASFVVQSVVEFADEPLSISVQAGTNRPVAYDAWVFTPPVANAVVLEGPATIVEGDAAVYTIRDDRPVGSGSATTEVVTLELPFDWDAPTLVLGDATAVAGAPTEVGVFWSVPSFVTDPGEVIGTIEVAVPSGAESDAGTLTASVSGDAGFAQDSRAVTVVAPPPYEAELQLPETAVPGETVPLAIVDVRPSGPLAGIGGLQLVLPDGLEVVPGTSLINDGEGGFEYLGEPFPFEGDALVYFDVSAQTLPGETVFTVDVAVSDDATGGDLVVAASLSPFDGAPLALEATLRVLVEPEVEVFGAVRGTDRVAVVGRLLGVPNALYSLGLSGFSDGCPVGAGSPYGTVTVETDGLGQARFGVALEELAEVFPAVRVVDAGELVEDEESEVPAFSEGPTYLGAEGWPGSGCVFAGFGNEAWPSALALTADDTVVDRITVEGSDRWYRVPVTPGTRVTVDLEDLPADLDLAGFTDIGAAFASEALDDPVAQLDRAGAQSAPSAFSPSAFSPSAFSPAEIAPSAFSPSAFSPSAFSPSAFSPSAFSPSAFSPSAFSPSAFSPSAFSPSAFSPSAFSPSAFSPSAFSPSAFSPSAFSPSAFSPDDFAPSAFSPSAFSVDDYAPSAFSPSAFSAAQTQSVIAVAATRGPAPEQLVLNTWDNDGFFYLRVTGAGGLATPDASYTLSVRTEGTSCDDVARIGAPPADEPGTGVETVVLWDSTRTVGTTAELATLATRLDELAAAQAGVVVDVADPSRTRLAALRAQLDEHPDCVFATNLYARAIKDVVDAHRASNPLRYVVLVGNDGAIPFFRYPDGGLLGPESDYEPPVGDQTISQAALRENQVLGQDEYGAETVLLLNGTRQPVPDLAVGRLVETAAEMTGMLDLHLEGEVLTPRSTLVTGYDFLTDAAEAVQEQLVAGTTDGVTPPVNDALLVAADVAPADPRSWTADDLRDAFLTPTVPHDLVYLAGHFSANSALAADYATSIVTTELAPSGVDLRGSVVFSGGCHSGYNIVDAHGVPGLTLQLDWAQAMAQQGATLVAGTGYQYGDTDLVEYSERLYAGFATELRRGTGVQTVGEALVRAKLDYLQSTPDPRGLHRKSLLIASVFGLPMTGVDMPGERLPVAPVVDVVPVAYDDGDAGVEGPAEQLDLAVAPVTVAPPVEREELQLDVIDEDGQPTPGPLASYLVGPDGTAVQPNEPILPLATEDVTAAGRSLRGVGFRGGTYVDEQDVVPLSGAATTELRGVHVPFSSEVFFPMRIATPNYYGALGADGRTRLHVTPVQHRVDRLGDLTATRRVFTSLDLELFYSDVVEVAEATPGLSSAPRIVEVESTVVEDPDDGVEDLEFLVTVLGDPGAGIEQVWVTYTEADGGTSWRSIDLMPCEDSTRWRGTLEDAGAASSPALDFVVQALSGTGRVGLDDAFGAYHRGGGTGVLPPVVDPPAPTQLVLVDVPGPTPVGGAATVVARLETDAAPVADARVLLSYGAAVRALDTAADGSVRATFPVTQNPGPVRITASFGGTPTQTAAAAATGSVVVRGGSVLTLLPDDEGGVALSLRGDDGRPLGEQTVVLVTDEARLAVITAPDGRAAVLGRSLPTGDGALTARFAGNTRRLAATATTQLSVAPLIALGQLRTTLVDAVPDLADARDVKHVEKAIERLDRAVERHAWGPDGTPQEADVLKELAKAAKELGKLEDADAVALGDEVAGALAGIARVAAVDTIAAVEADGLPYDEDATPEDVEEALGKAREELARGDEELADGRVEKAIKRWRKALDRLWAD